MGKKYTFGQKHFKIVEIEGKGVGCIALHDIEIGTLVMKLKYYKGTCGHQHVDSPVNHSCRPNVSSFKINRHLRMRTVSKILAGQEIVRSYDPICLGMKHLNARQKQLSKNSEFTCVCDLCKEEEENRENNNRDIYKKFRKLDNESYRLDSIIYVDNLLLSTPEVYDNCKKLMICYEKMQRLAMKHQAPWEFILAEIIEEGFEAGLHAYVEAKKHLNVDKIEYFLKKCMKWSRVGEKMAKIAFGNAYNQITHHNWGEINQNFENWFAENR